MNRFKLLFSLFLACAFTIGSFAQQKTASAWTARFKSPINWQRVHSLGYIIVSTKDGLYAVNPNDGKILWENLKFPSLNPDYFSEVEGTEFATVSFFTEKSSKIPMQAILEVVEGKVLFDSQKEQIGVLSRHVLPRSGKLLIIGAKPGTLSASLFMYDIISGKQLWSNDELFKADPAGKGFLGKLQAMGQQLSNLQGLTSEPLELQDQTVIVTHPNYVIKLQAADGKLLWKKSIEPSRKAGIYFSPYKKDLVFVGTEVESETGSGFTTTSSSGGSQEPKKFYYNYYYAFNLQSGEPAWKQPAKETDLLNQVIVQEKGLIICPRSSQKPTINFVDYATGETTWGKKGKGIKAQGSVVSYIPTSQGILITTAHDNAWNNKAEEYYLNVLDPVTGALKYEKSIKLKGDLVSSELTDKGLLFTTTREVNILDVATGKLLWENSIEAGIPFGGDKPRPFPTASKGDKLYVFSAKEGAPFEVDKKAGTFRKMTASKVELQGKEMPTGIEVMDDGILLYSDQNVVKLGGDGSQKFAKYYPAPREPALMRALLAAQAVRAAYIGAAASAYSAAFAQAAAQSNDKVGKAVGNELSSAYGQLGQAGFAYSAKAINQFNARYKATTVSPNFLVMMTKLDKGGHQLIQVNKLNGEIVRAVDVKNDKSPEYDVDNIYNYIYYRPTPTEIVCYKL
jgi:outer membrane protein assembly factor BamB